MTGDLLSLILVILLLILASAFFSSAETALTAASDARMRQLAGKGNRRAELVERLRDDREGLIGSILIGNNAVNVIASALATSVFISLLDDAGVLWATVTMTVILVVFAEVVPKTYALNNSDKYALMIAPPVRAIVIILSPLSIALRMLANSLIGTRRDQEADREEELRGMIELHGADGDADDRETQAMLSSVLDLNEISVEQIMTHRAGVKMVDADSDLNRSFATCWPHRIRATPSIRETRTTSSAFFTSRTCFAPSGNSQRKRKRRRSATGAACCRILQASPISFPKQRFFSTSFRHSGPGGNISPLWSTNMATCRASSRLRTFWRRLSAISMTNMMSTSPA